MRIHELIAVILSLTGIVLWMSMTDKEIERLDKRILVIETKLEMKK